MQAVAAYESRLRDETRTEHTEMTERHRRAILESRMQLRDSQRSEAQIRRKAALCEQQERDALNSVKDSEVLIVSELEDELAIPTVFPHARRPERSADDENKQKQIGAHAAAPY